MKEESDDLKMKLVKTKLGKNISATLPMIEEVTKLGYTPFCLIAFKPPKEGAKTVYTHWATISDSFNDMLMELCKQLAERGKPVVVQDDESNEPDTPNSVG